MEGPFPINSVNLHVTRTSPGAYVLSRNGKAAHYVGRSDTDLGQRILSSARQGTYTHFWFEYCTSPMRAFHTECQWWHKYSPSDNSIHPAIPAGTNWRCPIEGCQWS